jgi:hypothetical protein
MMRLPDLGTKSISHKQIPESAHQDEGQEMRPRRRLVPVQEIGKQQHGRAFGVAGLASAGAHPHRLLERDRGQLLPARRRRTMANVRAERLLKIPAELAPSCAAAQTRIVSAARIRLDPRKIVRPFKGIICDDISEFEPSHARSTSRQRSTRIRGLLEWNRMNASLLHTSNTLTPFRIFLRLACA